MKAIFTYVLTLVVTLSTFAEISISEKKTLIQFNKSTNGDQWSTKWDLNAPVSTWHGVTIQNDKVVAIDLSSNKLSGTLPSDIANLTFLRSLVLFQNEISGQIPSSIGNLKNLEQLNLSFNKFSGTIPEALSDAASLKSIELFMNRLNGNLPKTFYKLKSLEVLSLYNNDI